MPRRDLLDAVGRAAGVSIAGDHAEPVSGGSINRVYRVATSNRPLLLKVADAARLSMLEAEAEGLEALRAAGAIAVPEVAAVASAGDEACLALEWIDLAGRTRGAQAALGRGLAALHAHTSDRHGWHRDNTIGLTPQHNTPAADWAAFFRDRRLGFQLDLAKTNGLDARSIELGARLLERLGTYLGGHRPPPSLLHGDLWGGNWSATRDEVPYVFDPAVYYGDRETDLAMTRLFGGFGGGFYRAYEQVWPLEPGWQARADLYDLYHLLNHFNLFGAGYRAQVHATIARLAGALDA